ncbi:MAG: hypothetical protein HY696_04625 [Deltaproteobacteria bacterium]|nr:hypothetical protein [Deltaproteobacteria bacterium]
MADRIETLRAVLVGVGMPAEALANSTAVYQAALDVALDEMQQQYHAVIDGRRCAAPLPAPITEQLQSLAIPLPMIVTAPVVPQSDAIRWALALAERQPHDVVGMHQVVTEVWDVAFYGGRTNVPPSEAVSGAAALRNGVGDCFAFGSLYFAAGRLAGIPIRNVDLLHDMHGPRDHLLLEVQREFFDPAGFPWGKTPLNIAIVQGAAGLVAYALYNEVQHGRCVTAEQPETCAHDRLQLALEFDPENYRVHHALSQLYATEALRDGDLRLAHLQQSFCRQPDYEPARADVEAIRALAGVNPFVCE